MKVYILCKSDYNGYYIINVYSTKELAEEEKIRKLKEDFINKKGSNYIPKRLNTYIKKYGLDYFIEEYDVIK